ncbi:hypothetical protein BBF96_11515 [Anoxybacter fermentans]|uniref:Mutator family transposase n=1 Tax=Anoxybacter fermentans TaxID=1323375 RepID=A0A3S9T090_9FIRM|nr:transposase [Anoxybacter fermentans]AZR73964.1 hypothetical protein BBF96_11515 [Anoxybacter fermentans]
MNSILQKLLAGQVNLDSLLTDLIKEFIQKLLKAELTEFLNYEKYDPKGKNSGNSRNGYYTRNLKTKYGNIQDLKVPRNRNGEFNWKGKIT